MSQRLIAFVAAGLFSAGTLAGCAQLLGIEELEPGGSIDARPAEPDARAPGGTCMIDNGGCDLNADCIEAPDGIYCECRQGYVGDGYYCSMPWELVTTIPDLPFYNGFGAFAIGSGSSLFFFPESNDPPPSSFFASYDVLSGEIREEVLPPDATNDFCACGLTQMLVALDEYLYQFGNYGMRYHTILQTWEPLNYPPERARGEAAGAALGTSVYTFGGRDNARSVQYFDVEVLDWVDLGSTLPWDLDAGTAIAMPPNLIYVFGGRVDGEPNQAAVYDASDNAWQLLPDLPAGLYSSQGSGVVNDRLFLLSFDLLHLYDPFQQAWSNVPLPPLSYAYAATVGGQIYIVGALDNQVEIYRLADDMIMPGPATAPDPR